MREPNMSEPSMSRLKPLEHKMGERNGRAEVQVDGTSILEATLAAATRDRQTVRPDGTLTGQLTEGLRFRSSPTHVDERGTVVELFDHRWGFDSQPLVFAYQFTIRPGIVK